MPFASDWMSAGMVAEKSIVLALARDGRADAAHVVDEAHVEHAVRLVEHEVRHAVEAHEPLLHQVEQAGPAWR